MLRTSIGVWLLCLGCSTTVRRIDGPTLVRPGPATNDCERDDWVVVTPTRADLSGKGEPHVLDGKGLYRVGGSQPLDLTDPELLQANSPLLEAKSQAVDSHDKRRATAAALGAGSILSIVIGAAVFVSGFESETVTQRDGTSSEENRVNGTRVGLGAGLTGLGFAMGITGLLLNPDQGERARVAAKRYVVAADELDAEQLGDLAERHNQAVRERCQRLGVN